MPKPDFPSEVNAFDVQWGGWSIAIVHVLRSQGLANAHAAVVYDAAYDMTDLDSTACVGNVEDSKGNTLRSFLYAFGKVIVDESGVYCTHKTPLTNNGVKFRVFCEHLADRCVVWNQYGDREFDNLEEAVDFSSGYEGVGACAVKNNLGSYVFCDSMFHVPPDYWIGRGPIGL